jgi:hypothetical protein
MTDILKNLAWTGFIVLVSSTISCSGSGVKKIDLIPVSSGSDFQYISREGSIEINPQFTVATVFREGMALVMPSGGESRWGYIGEDGKYVINPQYVDATVFSEGLAWTVRENGAPEAINAKGEIQITLQQAEKVMVFSEGLAPFSIVDEEGRSRWGYADKKGVVKINPQFARAMPFSEGMAAVCNDEDKWGYIDKEGRITINPQFDSAENFSGGKAVVMSSEKSGAIGKDGKYLINPQFDVMFQDKDLFLIHQNGKWGWCDREGKIVINPQFTDAFPFAGAELAPVSSGKEYGYVDRDGKFQINPQFTRALPFNGDLAMVVSSGKIGFIREDGRFAINPQFSDVDDDYHSNVHSGQTIHTWVTSDYFDTSDILNAIDPLKPEGFSLSSTYGDVMKKYGLSASDFDEYSDEHEVLSMKRIGKNVHYSFYVGGEPFDLIQVQRGAGWFTYTDTEQQFNAQNIPSSYGYLLSLSGNAAGKEQAIMDALSARLKGFSRIDSEEEDLRIFTRDDMQVIMRPYGDGLAVVITRPESEESEYYD